jgi:heterodisulfide reductase subunit B
MKATVPPVYSYFPGCSLGATNRAYDISTRNVARVLGLEMVELEDWNCCGATPYMAIDPRQSALLSARNLGLSERNGRDIVTVCSSCYLVFQKANHQFHDDPSLRADVRKALQAGGMDYHGNVRVWHLLELLVNSLGREAIEQHVVQPLEGLKVACYYGCQLIRPFGEVDDPEFPRLLDLLMDWIGAKPVEFGMGAKCCGGILMTTQPELGLDLSGRILKQARRAGADCICTICPLCQMNLEAYQDKIAARMEEDCRIPILYFTQVLGKALGLGADELALEDALTPAETVLVGKSRELKNGQKTGGSHG